MPNDDWVYNPHSESVTCNNGQTMICDIRGRGGFVAAGRTEEQIREIFLKRGEFIARAPITALKLQRAEADIKKLQDELQKSCAEVDRLQAELNNIHRRYEERARSEKVWGSGSTEMGML